VFLLLETPATGLDVWTFLRLAQYFAIVAQTNDAGAGLRYQISMPEFTTIGQAVLCNNINLHPRIKCPNTNV
jgi:hypothetical protein